MVLWFIVTFILSNKQYDVLSIMNLIYKLTKLHFTELGKAAFSLPIQEVVAIMSLHNVDSRNNTCRQFSLKLRKIVKNIFRKKIRQIMKVNQLRKNLRKFYQIKLEVIIIIIFLIIQFGSKLCCVVSNVFCEKFHMVCILLMC